MRTVFLLLSSLRMRLNLNICAYSFEFVYLCGTCAYIVCVSVLVALSFRFLNVCAFHVY